MSSTSSALKFQALSMCAFALPIVTDPMHALSKFTTHTVWSFAHVALALVLSNADRASARNAAKIYLFVNARALVESVGKLGAFRVDAERLMLIGKTVMLALALADAKIPTFAFASSGKSHGNKKKEGKPSKAKTGEAKKTSSRAASAKKK